jgi:hypothetical protein
MSLIVGGERRHLARLVFYNESCIRERSRGIGDTEDKAATGSVERAERQASFKFMLRSGKKFF